MSKAEDTAGFIAMASFWALNYPLVKFAIVYQSSLSLLFFRIFFAAIASFIIFRKGIHFPRDLATNLKILVFSLLNLIFFMGFWFVGESTESSALSSIIIYSYPVITTFSYNAGTTGNYSWSHNGGNGNVSLLIDPSYTISTPGYAVASSNNVSITPPPESSPVAYYVIATILVIGAAVSFYFARRRH